jgi:uncharacterized protein (TIGR03437 family)
VQNSIVKPLELAGLCLLAAHTVFAQGTTGPTVRFETNLGNIDVVLLSGSAPRTVANFLNYVNRGSYNNTIFHRSVPGFVVQGGGFRFANGTAEEIPADPPVPNEFRVSNTRGTIAMAKLGGNPNSATNQWFFNLKDNTSGAQNLNAQNGGFTVFGRVADDASLAVMDKIAAVPVGTIPAWGQEEIPLIDYRGGSVAESHLVIVKSITVLDAMPPPAISGIVSASSFGASSFATAGSFIEIYGTNLAGNTREWVRSDFTGNRAPTSLDGVIVTINNQPGYVSYISPGQINVQVPASAPSNRDVQVVVLSRGLYSAPATLTLKPTAGGLLSPANFNVNGKRYAAAIHANGAFVANGEIAGVPAAPAAPGETIVFYGVGFGLVNPNTFPIAGQIAAGATSLATPLEFYIGEIRGQVLYAGFVPELVGLYQFNVTVPANAPTGDLPLRVVLGSETLPQTLVLPVRSAGN